MEKSPVKKRVNTRFTYCWNINTVFGFIIYTIPATSKAPQSIVTSSSSESLLHTLSFFVVIPAAITDSLKSEWKK